MHKQLGMLTTNNGLKNWTDFKMFLLYVKKHHYTLLENKSRPLGKSVSLLLKLYFLFLNQNICCGYSKEPSRSDGTFEHPEQMLKLID